MGHKNVTAVRVCADHPVNLSEPCTFPSPTKALKAALAKKYLNFLYLGRASLDRLLRCDDPNQRKAGFHHAYQLNIITKHMVLKLWALEVTDLRCFTAIRHHPERIGISCLQHTRILTARLLEPDLMLETKGIGRPSQVFKVTIASAAFCPKSECCDFGSKACRCK